MPSLSWLILAYLLSSGERSRAIMALLFLFTFHVTLLGKKINNNNDNNNKSLLFTYKIVKNPDTLKSAKAMKGAPSDVSF